MSGVLENMKATIDQLSQEVASLKAAVMKLGSASAGAPAAADDPFAGLGGATSKPAVEVTSDMILELIKPHISNEATKAKLGEAMKALGISNLNEAEPHQYADLYAKFQAVINGAGAAIGGGASII